ncbi:hypothetical protein JCM33374_g1588 [Metschnikowia sp. JCM 33374]|nr:hypothetical protein JCM33374_g1588 [Metschnikowia sp. JCM 33374]
MGIKLIYTPFKNPCSLSVFNEVTAHVPDNKHMATCGRQRFRYCSRLLESSFSKERPSAEYPDLAGGQAVKRGVTEDSSFEIGSLIQGFEHHVSALLKTIKRLKRDAVVSPQLLNSEYPQLLKEFRGLNDELDTLKSSGHIPTEVSLKVLKDLAVFLQMMELNIEMRLQGCEEQLKLAPGYDQDDISRPRKTVLFTYMEMFDEFSKSKTQLFDQLAKSEIDEEELQSKINSFRSEFEDLKGEFRGFIEQNTPLSRVFKEGFENIQTELTDLIGLRNSSLSDSIQHGASKKKPHQKGRFTLKLKTKKGTEQELQSKQLKELKNRLLDVLIVAAESNAFAKVQSFQKWREAAESISVDAFIQLSATEFANSPTKKRVKRLLKEVAHTISSKVNSLILLATAICSNGDDPDDEILELYSNLEQLLADDYNQVKSKLSQSLAELKRLRGLIKTKEDVSKFKLPIRIQKSLLKKVTSYIERVEWSKFSKAEDLKGIEREALGYLDDLHRMTQANGG